MSTDWGQLEPASLAWVNYIEAELERALPPGWRWERVARDWRRDPPLHLADVEWLILPAEQRGIELSHQLYTSPDGRLLLLTFGNTDAGAARRAWRQALAVDTAHLRHAPLGEVIRAVVGQQPPDRYGLT